MKKVVYVLGLVLSIALFACNQSVQNNDPLEDLTTSYDKSVTLVVDESVAESVTDEVVYEVEMYTNNQEKFQQRVKRFGNRGKFQWKNWLRYKMGQCPDVSIDSTNAGYPITITLDYGDATELKNGKILSGVVVVELSDSLFADGATKDITYQDFYVDSVKVSGNIEIVFTGDYETERKWNVVSDVTLTFPDGYQMHRTSEKQRQWLAGLDTPEEPSDDEIEKTGWVQIETSEDMVYLKEITIPLIKKGDCKWLVSGETTFTENGVLIIVKNWGDGTCDAIVTITKDGVTEDIDLEERKNDRSNKNSNGNNGNNGGNGNN